MHGDRMLVGVSCAPAFEETAWAAAGKGAWASFSGGLAGFLHRILPWIIALGLGYTYKEMEEGIVHSISKGMPAMMVVIVVGMLIGTWMSCGAIPMMIFYGLKVLSPGIFLAATMVICSVVSLGTGSSWSTAVMLAVLTIVSPAVPGSTVAVRSSVSAAAAATLARAHTPVLSTYVPCVAALALCFGAVTTLKAEKTDDMALKAAQLGSPAAGPAVTRTLDEPIKRGRLRTRSRRDRG